MLRETLTGVCYPCLAVRHVVYAILHIGSTTSYSAARSYLMCKTRQLPTWTTSKNVLNHLCEWESLKWRREILSLVYFHHVFYQFPALLNQFSFTISSSCRHPSSIVLPRSGTHFFKSPLFGLSVVWNKLPESLRTERSSAKFRFLLKDHYLTFKFSTTGIPDFRI